MFLAVVISPSRALLTVLIEDNIPENEILLIPSIADLTPGMVLIVSPNLLITPWIVDFKDSYENSRARSTKTRIETTTRLPE